MTDERSGSDDRGPLSGLGTEFTVDGETIDLSDNAGPELTTDLDDRAPSAGSSASRSDGEAVGGDDAGSLGGAEPRPTD